MSVPFAPKISPSPSRYSEPHVAQAFGMTQYIHIQGVYILYELQIVSRSMIWELSYAIDLIHALAGTPTTYLPSSVQAPISSSPAAHSARSGTDSTAGSSRLVVPYSSSFLIAAARLAVRARCTLIKRVSCDDNDFGCFLVAPRSCLSTAGAPSRIPRPPPYDCQRDIPPFAWTTQLENFHPGQAAGDSHA